MFRTIFSLQGITTTLTHLGLLFRKKPLELDDLLSKKDTGDAARLRQAITELEQAGGPRAVQAILASTIIGVALLHGFVLYIAIRILWSIVMYFI